MGSMAIFRVTFRPFSVTTFPNISFSNKTNPTPPISAPLQPRLLAASSDNRDEKKVRTNGLPTRFRLCISGMAPPVPLFATNLSGKPETRFRKSPCSRIASPGWRGGLASTCSIVPTRPVTCKRNWPRPQCCPCPCISHSSDKGKAGECGWAMDCPVPPKQRSFPAEFSFPPN